MFRRPPVRPPVPSPSPGIRFLDDPAPAPRPQPSPAPTAPARAPAKKRREWPIGTMAFLAVVGGGLLAYGPGRRNARLEETVSQAFAVEGSPRVVVETFGGPIQVERGGPGQVECVVTKQAAGPDEAATADELKAVSVVMVNLGDSIRVSARRLSARPGSAEARVRLRVPEGTPLVLTTGDGEVRVRGVEGAVEARSANGRIDVEDGEGPMTLNTANGSIACEADDALVAADTSNGAVEFRGTLAPGRASFHTGNGRVTLRLPEGQEFRVDAKSDNGKVESDFPVRRQRGSRSRHLVGHTGGEPETEITVRTGNGQVRILEDD